MSINRPFLSSFILLRSFSPTLPLLRVCYLPSKQLLAQSTHLLSDPDVKDIKFLPPKTSRARQLWRLARCYIDQKLQGPRGTWYQHAQDESL
ncbi:hypothetical protein DTO012A8_10159 [Penicillium roqueforti]|nr:hypothetical protein DTO012A8_10159 [Penicillium roqueforti]